MPVNLINEPTVSVKNISERGWPKVPGKVLDYFQPISLAGNNSFVYDIDINFSYGLETFGGYYYIWNGTEASQDDSLSFQVTGAFALGAGDDNVTNNIQIGYSTPAYVLLGEGNDTYDGSDQVNNQSSTVLGGGGDDTIVGGQYNDTLFGDEADTFVFELGVAPVKPSPAGFPLAPYDAANDGDDTIDGADGDDTIAGGGGNDRLSGGNGNDVVSASSGNNQLYGGNGADTLTGGTGSDYLYGGPRGDGFLDILTGGGGSDTFVLSYSEDAPSSAGDFWSGFFGS